jgi:hypothetical protein
VDADHRRHAAHHIEQAFEIMRDHGFAPEGVC